MKQSGTTLKTLARRYRAVLIKCALINLAAFAVVSSAQALNISSGTYKDEQINDTDITISGGTFDNVMISAENSLKITGGTFRGAFNSGLTSNLNLFGGNFDGLDWWEYGGAANDLNIDSDKTVLNLKAGKNFHDLRAGQMNISGDRGISLTKTNLSVGTLSGKATLNKDAFAGNFQFPFF